MPVLTKPYHIAQEIQCVPVRPAAIRMSYAELGGTGSTLLDDAANEYTNDLVRVSKSAQGTNVLNADGVGVEIGSYNSTWPGGLPALILISAEAGGLGWTLKFQMSANEYNHYSLYEGAVVSVVYSESLDNADYKSATIFRAVLLDAHFTFGLFGEQTVELTGFTVDKMLDGFNAPPLPYLQRAAAEGEINWWAPGTRSRTEGSLQHELYDEAKRGDPFSGTSTLDGFGAIIDQLEIIEGRFTNLPPANVRHFLDSLAPLFAILEMFENHVQTSGGNGWLPFNSRWPYEIEAGGDGLNDLLHYTLDAGSIMSIIAQQAKHGWLVWTDNLSKLHVIKDDWFRPSGEARPVSLSIPSTRSMFGEFSTTPAVRFSKAGRVITEALWSATTAEDKTPSGTNPGNASTRDMNPLENHFAIPNSHGAVYPRIPLAELVGNELDFKQVATKNPKKFAAGKYQEQKFDQQAAITGMPYIGLAAALFNRIVQVSAKDPRGAFDFSTNPTKFRVTGVRIKLAGIDKAASGGGYYLADLTLRQIVDLPPGV